MNSKTLLFILTVAALSSCSTAYKGAGEIGIMIMITVIITALMVIVIAVAIIQGIITTPITPLGRFIIPK